MAFNASFGYYLLTPSSWVQDVSREELNYRSIHPKYCDVLADLLGLPVGTKFFVTDGRWYGEILQNNFVFIHSIFGTWAIKISPEHHSLYLELENKTL